MSEKSEDIDVEHIEQSDCILKDFPLQELKITERPSGFQIVVRRSTLNAMKSHGRTSMNAEVGGMLLGNLCWDSEPFLILEVSIIGKHTNENAASVTFTAETWDYVWKEQEEKYPDTNIVGWYHTHPGFGIFLSQMDLFICEHTFNAPHQVAYVYDPQSEDDGWFFWKQSQPTKLKSLLIIEDEPALPITISSQSRRSFKMRTSADKITISEKDFPATSPPETGGCFVKTLLVLNFSMTLILAIGVVFLAYIILQKHEAPILRPLEWKSETPVMQETPAIPETPGTLVPVSQSDRPAENAETESENVTSMPVESDASAENDTPTENGIPIGNDTSVENEVTPLSDTGH